MAIAGYTRRGGAMKVVKIIATVLLSVLLCATLLAAQMLLLAQNTVLDPAFYGAPQSEAYNALGRYAVRALSDIVLDLAPPEALRTEDRAQAFALALKALPTQQVARLVQDAAPNLARYALQGGAVPVLGDAASLDGYGTDLLSALLKDGALLFVPESSRPKLSDYLPFTAKWNDAYRATLEQWAAPLRLAYARLDLAVLIAVGGVVFCLAFLYLLWMRSPRPFYLLCGWMLMAHSALFAAVGLALRFFHRDLLAAVLTAPVQAMFQPAFLGVLPDLTAAALQPFSSALLALALIVFGFSLLCFGVSVDRGLPVAPPTPPRRFKFPIRKLRAKPAE